MILFLGAGASNPFGIPVARSFATDAINTLSSDPDYKQYKDFLTDLQKPFGGNFDLEVLLTLLDDLSHPNTLDIISPITTKFILTQSKPEQFVNDKGVKDSSHILFTAITDYMRKTILTKTNENKKTITSFSISKPFGKDLSISLLLVKG